VDREDHSAPARCGYRANPARRHRRQTRQRKSSARYLSTSPAWDLFASQSWRKTSVRGARVNARAASGILKSRPGKPRWLATRPNADGAGEGREVGVVR